MGVHGCARRHVPGKVRGQHAEGVQEVLQVQDGVGRGGEKAKHGAPADGERHRPPPPDRRRHQDRRERHQHGDQPVVLGRRREAGRDAGDEKPPQQPGFAGDQREQQRFGDEKRQRGIGERKMRFAHEIGIDRGHQRRNERDRAVPSPADAIDDVHRHDPE